jgi:predicted Zn-dependent peptidase
MDIEACTLANGLKVASVRLPGFRTACIGAYVRVGSRYEPAHLAGVSHFFEHMAFKGTRERDAYRIAFDAERAGAYINAFTAKDHTGYYLHLPGDQAETAVELIADVLRRSAFPRDELERERHVVLQEMAEAGEDAENVAQDLLDDAAFPRHALGRPILGKRTVVRTIHRREFTRFLARHYSATNIALVGVGAVDHAKFKRMAHRHFGDLPAGSPNRSTSALFRGGYRAKTLDNAQTWIAIGWPTPGRESSGFTRYELLAELLGGGTASPLFHTLREQHGLAYAVSTTIEGFEEIGVLQVTLGVAPRHVRKAIKLIAEVLTQPIEGENLERAIQQLRAQALSRLERPQSIAETIGLALLTRSTVRGLGASLESRLKLIESTPRAEIDMIRRAMITGTPALAIAGRAGRAGRGDHFRALQERLVAS